MYTLVPYLLQVLISTTFDLSSASSQVSPENSNQVPCGEGLVPQPSGMYLPPPHAPSCMANVSSAFLCGLVWCIGEAEELKFVCTDWEVLFVCWTFTVDMFFLFLSPASSYRQTTQKHTIIPVERRSPQAHKSW